MSKVFEMFQIGLDKEENPVLIPLIHTLVAGTTGVGKTEVTRKTIRAMQKAIPGLKVLIFDSKSTGRDWEGFGKDVKPFVRTSTETRFLRDLIETSEERKIDFYLYELDVATQGAETWNDVYQNLKKRHAHYKERKRELKEEKLGVLLIYMRGLINGFKQMETSDKFDLSAPITVVPINYAEPAFKQLVVYTYLKEIKKRRLKHILMVNDEMHQFAPSKRGTGCRRIIEEYYQEGRAAGNFGIASDQEIVGISPTVRSQCWNWILGMQTDEKKAKRVVDHLPTGTVKFKEVMTLGVGWFFAVIRTPTQTTVIKFYLLPDGISVEVGKKVVRGTLSVEEVMKKIRILRSKKEDDDLKHKERAEKAETELKNLKRALLNDYVKKTTHQAILKQVKEESAKNLSKERDRSKEFQDKLHKSYEDLSETKDKLKRFGNLGTALVELITYTVNLKMRDLPAKVNAEIKKQVSQLKLDLGPDAFSFPKLERSMKDLEKKLLDLEDKLAGFEPGAPVATSKMDIIPIVDQRLSQMLAGKKEIRVVTVDIPEKIHELVKHEATQPIIATIQNLNNIQKKAVQFVFEVKKTTVGPLYTHLYQKTGRPPGAFYVNVVNPLKNSGIISLEQGEIQWIFQRTLETKLPFLSGEEVKQLYEYLTSQLL